jgi:hypothetical protein
MGKIETITTIFYLSSSIALSFAIAPPQDAGTFTIYLLDSVLQPTWQMLS